jgi:exopolysaccharide production protein ExoQ
MGKYIYANLFNVQRSKSEFMIRREGEININRNSVDIIKRIYGVLVFLASTGAIIPVIRENMGVDYSNLEVDYAMRKIWIVIYFITLILIVSNWKRFLEVLFANKLIWMIFGFTLLSATWSVSPLLTLRRCIALFFTQIIGIYLYSEYGFEGVLEILKWASLISIVLSCIFPIFFPAYGIQHDGIYDGVWRGVYINKNLFGQNMVLFIPLWMLTFLEKVKTDRSKSILPFIFLIISVILLIKSESKTSLVVCLIIILIIPVCNIIRKNPILAIGLFFAAINIGVIILSSDFGIMNKLLASMGKDATLTGRTQIWSYAIQAIKTKPFFGYGYGAFFQGFKGPSEFICNLMEFAIFEAHNGYLGITLDLGIIGFSIFIFSLIKNVVNSLLIQSWYKNYIVIFSIIFIVYFLIFNITEAIVIAQNQISWTMYSFIATYISCELKKGVMLNYGY